MTKRLMVGDVAVGGGAPVSIQSMCNTKTDDVRATVEQIHALEAAGCEIIRIAIPDQAAAEAVDRIKEQISIPLIADIHFNYKYALACAERGIDAIRINPGNIGGEEKVKAVADICRQKSIPIRIGVNGGSLEKDLRAKYGGVTAEALVESAMGHVALIRRIREAGLVGMGGATFPTDIKANIGKVETLIANACECEPYITADDALLCTDADQAIRGLRLLRQLLKPRRTVIAIEDNKERAVSILTDKLKQQDEVELVVLPTRYPQGAEKQLIQAVTGRQVPSGGFPKDVGCAVFNIATCASVCRAVADGEPILRRIVTITGHGIKEPKNLIVPIGTPFAHAIEAAGGLQGDVWKVIAGGPMMGRSQADLSTPVIKGTNAIVALTSADDLESPHPSCIRCGRCVSVCPMGLQPLYLYRFSRCRDVGMLRQYSILDCVECGCCAYTCPGKLPIVAAIREGKQRVREEPS